MDALTVYTQTTGGGARVRAPSGREDTGDAGPTPSVHTLHAAFRAASSRATSVGEAADNRAKAEDNVVASSQLGLEQGGTEATHEMELDELLEEVPEVPPAPPQAPLRQRNGQLRSRRGVLVRSSWPCPECGWTAEGARWKQLKAAHIRKPPGGRRPHWQGRAAQRDGSLEPGVLLAMPS